MYYLPGPVEEYLHACNTRDQQYQLTCSSLQPDHDEQTSAVPGIPFPELSGGISEEVVFVPKISTAIQGTLNIAYCKCDLGTLSLNCL